MVFRFLHTADWQIGKPFSSFKGHAEALREARLEVITAIGRLAVAEDVRHVLVAGDVYDSEAPNRRTQLAPLERMRAFDGVTWHLLPGNHDPHRPGGLWERLASDMPENVQPRLEAVPIDLGEAVVLPAPLRGKAAASDPTAWMDDAPSAEGKVRIGLAHGSVTGFGSERDAPNLIDPARAERAGLGYLALGDWHRTLKVNDRIWYSGTPEPDQYGSQEVGGVLVVECGPGGPPQVGERPTGRFRWRTEAFPLHGGDDIGALDARIRSHEDPGHSIVRLVLSGALSLSDQHALAQLLERLDAVTRRLDVDRTDLRVRPTQEDVDRLELGGVLHTVAERLRARLGDAPDAATIGETEEALVELYLHARQQAGGETVR